MSMLQCRCCNVDAAMSMLQCRWRWDADAANVNADAVNVNAADGETVSSMSHPLDLALQF
ncbi:hypothetical protein MauCBS54593_000461 [Microsporum audouinii]